jgi:hypothetical protein
MKTGFAIGFVLALSAAGLSQTVVVDNRMGGYAYNSPYNRLYNARTQVNFSGVITGIQRAKPMANMDTGVTLLVKNDNGGGTAVVDLGPAWFVDRQAAKLKTKQRVEVVGSKVFVDGRGVILAKLVKAGSQVLALRRINGRPYWDIAQPIVLGPDPNVVEITGTIDSYRVFGTGADSYSGLVLTTADGALTVDMGPSWFFEPQQFNFQNGNVITIATNRNFGVDGAGNVVPAYWFRNGGNTYFLRNSANGMGIWQGWRP